MSWPPPNSPEAAQTKPASSRFFTTTLPPITDNELSNLLAQNKVTLRATEPSPSLLFLLINFAPLIIIGALILWTFSRSRQQQGNIFGFGQTRARRYNDHETPLITSNLIPFSARKSASSPPRPKMNGSPPLSRRTLLPILA